jgi:hypothetical protein
MASYAFSVHDLGVIRGHSPSMAYISRLLKWGRSSLIGHVVLLELFAALPLLLWAFATMISESTFTLARATRVVVVCVGLTAISAIAIWYTIMVPLRKGIGRR